MFQYHYLNKISEKGTAQWTEDYALGAELEQTDATILHVTPFNSFPSGITASVSKRHEYLRWAESRGGYIIEDNYDSELTVSKKNEDTVFSLDDDGRVLYLNTFSKTVATPSFLQAFTSASTISVA